MNELMQQISSDLAIEKFKNESYMGYGNRIVYAALASWGRTLVLGTSYTELALLEKDYHYTSQRYIIEKLENISRGLIDSIPHTNEYFDENNKNCDFMDISRYFIDKLIFSYQLNKLKNKQWVTPTPRTIVYFKNNKLILGEYDWNNKKQGAFSVGLGVWQKNIDKINENFTEVFNIPQYTIKGYYNSIKQNALWKQSDLDFENIEYFSGGTGLWHNKAWKKLNKKYIPNGISVIRPIDKRHEYALMLYDEGKYYTAKLDQWYVEENEVKRIMYMLECYRNNPAQFKAKRIEDIIELHCHSTLPNAESRIMLMASWPKEVYNNTFVRQIPKVLWEDIKCMLNSLGIKIIFE
ncbi:hypothetical protein [Clostridium sp. SM-530-WT-3G]|uniref:hypothetical protein n=1 Tax=Clostridium sp. SM-530-WT-3G TaxID=2725303 RepID=UPI00145F92AC|nr:hypothetical protein [Clostridium sp. SM-530-WT-3G]NME82597.1 hypothetical protein [Clostridium sp. SM-530-WT-3G]